MSVIRIAHCLKKACVFTMNQNVSLPTPPFCVETNNVFYYRVIFYPSFFFYYFLTS
jgi:hypothetical protein